jgi:class 3 adenylate cyclase
MWRIRVIQPADMAREPVVVDKQTVTVGRTEDNDIALPDSRVSRRHATLTLTGDMPFAEDLGSMNGTFMKKGDQWRAIEKRCAIPRHSVLRMGTRAVLEVDALSAPVTTVKARPENLLASESIIRSIGEFEREQAIMVLDLCESTKIASRDERMAFHLKERLAAISNAVLSRLHVDFFKSTGDGFLATFTDIRDALDGAKEILNKIEKRNAASTNPPINIRIGLHAGKTYTINETAGDIHGSDVNLAFRLEGVQPEDVVDAKRQFPRRNRILCSSDFVTKLRRPAARRNDFILCGHAKLKGIADPVEIYHFLHA